MKLLKTWWFWAIVAIVFIILFFAWPDSSKDKTKLPASGGGANGGGNITGGVNLTGSAFAVDSNGNGINLSNPPSNIQ